MTLAEMGKNQKKSILGYTSTNESMDRLQSLGVIPGAQAEILRAAPFGDPLQVKVDGTLLSIRLGDAKNIQVGV